MIKSWRLGVVWCFILLAVFLVYPINRVQGQAMPPLVYDSTIHIVQPGETLFSIARYYGMDSRSLMRLNDLSDPRKIYPGQRLHILAIIDGVDVSDWVRMPVSIADDVLSLARRGDVPWDVIAAANHKLGVENLLVGQLLYLPGCVPSRKIIDIRAGDTLLASALRHDISWWQLQQLNTGYARGTIVIPADSITTTIDSPIVSLSPQPVQRGHSAILAVTSGLDIITSCSVSYLDTEVDCFVDADAYSFSVPLGISTFAEPGMYTLTVHMETENGVQNLVVPFSIAPSVLDFERVDLPPSRQSLLDPAAGQDEAQRVAAAWSTLTPVRLWSLPFIFPVQSEMSSYFGSRRAYSGQVFNSYHAGNDFNASEGTPVVAPSNGIVVLADKLNVRGNAIIINHGWGVLSGYWHLSRIFVEPGQSIEPGQVLGLVGNTGLSTGAHLHWELRVNGVAVDALQWVEDFTTAAPAANIGSLE